MSLMEEIMHEQGELKQIAIDIVDGKIFSSLSIKNPSELGFIFMPLALGAFSEKTKEEIEDVGILYEYMSESSRTINGNPSFLSFRFLSKKDSETVISLIKEYQKIKEGFANG